MSHLSRKEGLRMLATSKVTNVAAIEEAIATIVLQHKTDQNQRSKQSVLYEDRIRAICYAYRDHPPPPDISLEMLAMHVTPPLLLHNNKNNSQKPPERHDLSQVLAERLDMTSLDTDHMSDQKALLRCSRCKSDRVSFRSEQNKGADEQMTVVCECLNCERKWKMN